MTDPWSIYSLECQWEARIRRLDQRLSASLAAACVEHALSAIPSASQGMLGRARQALWLAQPASQRWINQLQQYTDQVAEALAPDDPPLRAIDALVYAFDSLFGETPAESTLEALYHAFWSFSEAICPLDDWVSDLLEQAGLMEALDAQIGACQAAYQVLCFQETALEQVEARGAPLKRRDIAELAARTNPDESQRQAFARDVFQRALANLAQATSANLDYLRVLLRYAAFEQDCGNNAAAAQRYRQALAALQSLDKTRALTEVSARLDQLHES